MRSEVFAAVNIIIPFFWDVTLCSLIGRYHCFRKNLAPPLSGRRVSCTGKCGPDIRKDRLGLELLSHNSGPSLLSMEAASSSIMLLPI
jgi:hypothetical protein